MKVQIYSDYVCPYCLLAKIPFEQAADGKDMEIEYLPFELTEEPGERVDIYHDPVRRKAWKEFIMPVSERLDIGMKLPNVVPRPYTRLAFEGFYFAKEQGLEEKYNSRVFTAFFVEEQDIGDIAVLTKLAEEIGLNKEAFRESLNQGIYTKTVKDSVRFAKENVKITTVPTIFINGEQIPVVYTKKEYEEILEKFEGSQPVSN